MAWFLLQSALASPPTSVETAVSAPGLVVDEAARAACLLAPRGITAGKATVRGVSPPRLYDLVIPKELASFVTVCQSVQACDLSAWISEPTASCLIGSAHWVGVAAPPAYGAPLLVVTPSGPAVWTQEYRETGDCWTPATLRVDVTTGAISGDPPMNTVCK